MKYSLRFGLIPATTATLSIRARVNWGGSRIDVRLGISVEPDKWNASTGRMVANTTSAGRSAYAVNRTLSDIENAIAQVFALADLNGSTPSSDDVRHRILSITGKDDRRSAPSHRTEEAEDAGTIYPVLYEFITTVGKQNEWTTPSYQKYMALGEHLKRYCLRLTFDDLTEDGIHGFVESLHREGLRNTTIANHLGYLRTFLRWAKRKGHPVPDDFETFRPRLRGSDGSLKEVIYLEWDELMKLYNYDFTDRHRGLAAVRDVFCFQCFTGLRYSDVSRLRSADINLQGDYISIVTQKTGDPLRIELNDYSRAILDRYSDKTLQGGLALPIISNVNMNAYLKDIGRMIGLDTPCRTIYYKGNNRIEEIHPKWELLTTHCGRRTFVVNALALGIPAEVIMKWTGHKDFKAMRPYVKIIDNLRSREMQKFNIPSKSSTQADNSEK